MSFLDLQVRAIGNVLGAGVHSDSNKRLVSFVGESITLWAPNSPAAATITVAREPTGSAISPSGMTLAFTHSGLHRFNATWASGAARAFTVACMPATFLTTLSSVTTKRHGFSDARARTQAEMRAGLMSLASHCDDAAIIAALENSLADVVAFNTLIAATKHPAMCFGLD